MGQLFKEAFELGNRFFFGHILNHHCKIVVVAACACINKICFVHCFYNVAQNFICRDVTINFINNPEFLDVKMNECVIINSMIHWHFKERHKMIPVVVICNCVIKSKLVKSLFFKMLRIFVYNVL